MKNIITIIMAIVLPFVLTAQDNTFNGTINSDWDTATNWSTGKVPPTNIVQKITITANCIVSAANSTNYTFTGGSTFQINSGITFTNNGVGTWIMDGIYDKDGTYVGNLTVNGLVKPGDNVSTWVCGDALVYGGQSYATVEIGGQCWMAEDLNVGTIINAGSNQTNNAVIEKYCYGSSTANCDTYGGLYQWDEMMQYTTTESTQGVCPTDWHLPSDGEWTTLTGFLGGNSVAGGKMKETGTGHWNPPNIGATNSSGFTILPGGFRHINGSSFLYQGGNAFLWSSTEASVSFTWYRSLSTTSTGVLQGGYNKGYGFSVRCVRD